MGFAKANKIVAFFGLVLTGKDHVQLIKDTEIPKLGETHSLDESPSMSFLCGGVFLSAITRKKGEKKRSSNKKGRREIF